MIENTKLTWFPNVTRPVMPTIYNIARVLIARSNGQGEFIVKEAIFTDREGFVVEEPDKMRIIVIPDYWAYMPRPKYIHED